MWATGLLLALFGAAIASVQPGQELPGWENGKMYVYKLRSRSFASNNEINNQYSGVVTQAQLYLQVSTNTPNQLNAYVKDAQFAQVQQTLPGGWDAPLQGPAQPKWQRLRLRNPYFAIKMEKGVAKKLIIDKNTILSDANYYRSIVTQLTAKLHPNLLQRSLYPSYSHAYGSYNVME
ncbi:Vitellogenin-like Protein, partial [Gryllus bimaculatus]